MDQENRTGKRSFGGFLWLLVIIALVLLWWVMRPGDEHGTAVLDSRGQPVASDIEAQSADPDDILVDLRDDASAAQIAAIEQDLGIDLVLVSDQSADEQFYRAHVDPAQRDAVLAALARRPEVEIAEPDAAVNLI